MCFCSAEWSRCRSREWGHCLLDSGEALEYDYRRYSFGDVRLRLSTSQLARGEECKGGPGALVQYQQLVQMLWQRRLITYSAFAQSDAETSNEGRER